MKPLTLKLIRKVLKGVERKLDCPKYRVKTPNVIVNVHELSVFITDKKTGMHVQMSRDDYFKIRDQIKSYSKKNENNSVEVRT